MGSGSSGTSIKNSKKTSRPIIVLVDIDGTIANFEAHFLRRFREKYPYEPYIECEERNTRYIDDQYVQQPGASSNIKEKIYSILGSEDFYRDMPEIDGAVKALKSMNNMKGIEVFLVTSSLKDPGGCSNYGIPGKFQWVEDHLGVNWVERIVLTKDKTVITGDLLIDDNVFITGEKSKPSWKQVVFTACYNQNMDTGNIQRLDNWKEVSWKPLIQRVRSDV